MTAIAATFFVAAIVLALRALAQPAANSLLQRIAPAPEQSSQLRRAKRALVTQNLLDFRKRTTLAKSTQQQIQVEMPEILDFLWAATSAGMSLLRAIESLVDRSSGVLSSEFSRFLKTLNLGGNFFSELEALAKRLPVRQVQELTHKIELAIERGSPLAQMLGEQAASARAELQNALMQKSGRNETRMLIPLVFLILPVTVLFAIYPSLQLLNLTYQ